MYMYIPMMTYLYTHKMHCGVTSIHWNTYILLLIPTPAHAPEMFCTPEYAHEPTILKNQYKYQITLAPFNLYLY